MAIIIEDSKNDSLAIQIAFFEDASDDSVLRESLKSLDNLRKLTTMNLLYVFH